MESKVNLQPNKINLQLEEKRRPQKQQQKQQAAPTFLSMPNIEDKLEEFPSNEKNSRGQQTEPVTDFRSIINRQGVISQPPRSNPDTAGIFDKIKNSLRNGGKFTANNFSPRPIPVRENFTTSTSSTTEATTTASGTVAKAPKRIIISSIITDEDKNNLEMDEFRETEKEQLVAGEKPTYVSGVCMLRYLRVQKPELGYSAKELSHGPNDPNEPDWQRLKTCARFLLNDPTGIVFPSAG